MDIGNKLDALCMDLKLLPQDSANEVEHNHGNQPLGLKVCMSEQSLSRLTSTYTMIKIQPPLKDESLPPPPPPPVTGQAKSFPVVQWKLYVSDGFSASNVKTPAWVESQVTVMIDFRIP